MKILARVLVSDLLGALCLPTDKLPEGCELKLDEFVDVDDAEVDDDDAYEALQIDEQIESEFESQFDQTDVMELSAAVRMGNRQEAELLLDKIFGHNPTIREWVERGRYSGPARRLKAA
jgi:hypothetical protein